MSETDEKRIAREEEHWNAPRLFVLGATFLGACIVLIYVMASLRGPMP